MEEGKGKAEVRNEIEIESEGKVECVSKCCGLGLGDMIGSGGGAEEASTARVRRDWAIVSRTVSKTDSNSKRNF